MKTSATPTFQFARGNQGVCDARSKCVGPVPKLHTRAGPDRTRVSNQNTQPPVSTAIRGKSIASKSAHERLRNLVQSAGNCCNGVPPSLRTVTFLQARASYDCNKNVKASSEKKVLPSYGLLQKRDTSVTCQPVAPAIAFLIPASPRCASD